MTLWKWSARVSLHLIPSSGVVTNFFATVSWASQVPELQTSRVTLVTSPRSGNCFRPTKPFECLTEYRGTPRKVPRDWISKLVKYSSRAKKNNKCFESIVSHIRFLGKGRGEFQMNAVMGLWTMKLWIYCCFTRLRLLWGKARYEIRENAACKEGHVNSVCTRMK